MLLEHQHHLRAERHERTDVWYGYANEFKDSTLKILLGTIELANSQVCGSDEPFCRASIHAAMASEQALRFALAAILNQGVDLRRLQRCS